MQTSVDFADNYFATRLGASSYWTSGTEKESALATAETMLETQYSMNYNDNGHKKAVCEQALFLIVDQEGIQARSYLQAQGVSTSVMKEQFRPAPFMTSKFKEGIPIPIAPLAAALLGDAIKGVASIKIKQLIRDDSEDEYYSE